MSMALWNLCSNNADGARFLQHRVPQPRRESLTSQKQSRYQRAVPHGATLNKPKSRSVTLCGYKFIGPRFCPTPNLQLPPHTTGDSAAGESGKGGEAQEFVEATLPVLGSRGRACYGGPWEALSFHTRVNFANVGRWSRGGHLSWDTIYSTGIKNTADGGL